MRFRKKFKIPQHAYVVGYVGRLAMEKNLKYLATAVSLFLKEKPEALFLVVGTGPSEKEMKEIFKEHGVGGQIIFAGSQSGRALYDAYNAMNLFAFASFSETQGMVLAEAMAAGLPVVALDANGVREVVQQNTNGFLLPEKTPDRIFAHHLEILRSNASLQQRFADSARTTAYKFSKEHCAELALKFYGKINKSTRRARMQTDITPWGTLLERVNMEWKLLAQKTQSVMNAITSDKDNTD